MGLWWYGAVPHQMQAGLLGYFFLPLPWILLHYIAWRVPAAFFSLIKRIFKVGRDSSHLFPCHCCCISYSSTVVGMIEFTGVLKQKGFVWIKSSVISNVISFVISNFVKSFYKATCPTLFMNTFISATFQSEGRDTACFCSEEVQQGKVWLCRFLISQGLISIWRIISLKMLRNCFHHQCVILRIYLFLPEIKMKMWRLQRVFSPWK